MRGDFQRTKAARFRASRLGPFMHLAVRVEFALHDGERRDRPARSLPMAAHSQAGGQEHPNGCTLATFVAQLAANYLQLPQTRARRWCAQHEASGAYAATSQPPAGRLALDRSV